MTMIRLIIADDHPIVREGLKQVVAQSRDFQVVAEAEDGDAVVRVCQHDAPDVLLLDVSMPGPGVLELIPVLKAAQPCMRILVLSVHPERHYARRVLKAGADGYLTKNQSSQALASAIRQVYSGRKYVSATLAEDMAVELATAKDGQAHEALSNREFEVFLSLGAGESIEHIASQLKVSPKTVRTYRSRILEKMNLRSTAQIIFYALRWGLVTEVTTRRQSDRSGNNAPGRSSARHAKPPQE